MSDLRFGRADSGLGPEEAPFIFTWQLVPTPDGAEMAQAAFAPRLSGDLLRRLWDRIVGRTSEDVPR